MNIITIGCLFVLKSIFYIPNPTQYLNLHNYLLSKVIVNGCVIVRTGPQIKVWAELELDFEKLLN